MNVRHESTMSHMLADSLNNLSYTDASQIVDVSTTGGTTFGVNRRILSTGTFSQTEPDS